MGAPVVAFVACLGRFAGFGHAGGTVTPKPVLMGAPVVDRGP